MTPEQLLERNLQFFSAYNPALAEKYSSYTPTKYKPCITNGHVNIHDIENDVVIYPCSTKEFGDKQVAQYARQSLGLASAFDVDDNNKFLEELIKTSMHKDIGKVVSTPNINETMGMCLVFGVGLGGHIESLLETYDMRTLVVIEPCDDMFYSSLYATDWSSVCNKGVNITFVNTSNPTQLFQTLRMMLMTIGFHNYVNSFMFIHAKSMAINELFDGFKRDMHHLVLSDGFYEDERVGLAHCTANLEKGLPFMIKRDVKQKAPLFLVANGPSLDNDIEWLRKNRNKGVVCSAGSTLFTLYKAGIKPHIHFEMERGYDVSVEIGKNIPKRWLRDITFITLCTSHPDTIKLFKDAYLVAKDADINIPFIMAVINKEVAIPRHMNPTVSNFILSYAVNAGFKEIYMMGCDMGTVNKEQHHSSTSVYYDKGATNAPKFNDEFNIPTKASFGGDAYTTPILQKSATSISSLLLEHPDVKVYNMSDGVLVRGTTPIRSEWVSLLKPVRPEMVRKMLKKGFEKPIEGSLLRAAIRRDLGQAKDYLMAYTLPEKLPSRDELYKLLSTYTDKVLTYNYSNHRMLSGTTNHLALTIYGVMFPEYTQERWELVKEHVDGFVTALINMHDTELFNINWQETLLANKKVFNLQE